MTWSYNPFLLIKNGLWFDSKIKNVLSGPEK